MKHTLIFALALFNLLPAGFRAADGPRDPLKALSNELSRADKSDDSEGYGSSYHFKDVSDFKTLSQFPDVRAFEADYGSYQQDCLDHSGGGSLMSSCYLRDALWYRELETANASLSKKLDGPALSLYGKAVSAWDKTHTDDAKFTEYFSDLHHNAEGTMYSADGSQNYDNTITDTIRQRALLVRDWDSLASRGAYLEKEGVEDNALLDQKLNLAYAHLKSKLKPSEYGLLIHSERDWIASRDAAMAFNGSLASPQNRAVLNSLIQSRLLLLRDWLELVLEPPDDDGSKDDDSSKSLGDTIQGIFDSGPMKDFLNSGKDDKARFVRLDSQADIQKFQDDYGNEMQEYEDVSYCDAGSIPDVAWKAEALGYFKELKGKLEPKEADLLQKFEEKWLKSQENISLQMPNEDNVKELNEVDRTKVASKYEDSLLFSEKENALILRDWCELFQNHQALPVSEVNDSAQLDRKLNLAYKGFMAVLTSESQQGFKKCEEDWLEARDAALAFNRLHFPKRENELLRSITSTRISFLLACVDFAEAARDAHFAKAQDKGN